MSCLIASLRASPPPPGPAACCTATVSIPCQTSAVAAAADGWAWHCCLMRRRHQPVGSIGLVPVMQGRPCPWSAVGHWSHIYVGHTQTHTYRAEATLAMSVEILTSKAASRLHFLKQLKRSGAEHDPAVLLRHGDSDSTGVRLSYVALQSHRRTDEGTGVAAAHRMCIILQDRDYTITRCPLSEPNWTGWSHNATSRLSASSSAVSCQRRHAFTICFRTSAIPLSRTDSDIQETSNLCNLGLLNSEILSFHILFFIYYLYACIVF